MSNSCGLCSYTLEDTIVAKVGLRTVVVMDGIAVVLGPAAAWSLDHPEDPSNHNEDRQCHQDDYDNDGGPDQN